MKVFVALATYNGAAWLREQLDSLRAQQFTQWELLIRDDGSTDATPALLADYACRDPRITIIPSTERFGVVGNFSCLLTEAYRRGADWVFLADQDDFWYPDKISRTLDHGLELAAAAPTRPLLVHTDLAVVNQRRELIHPSFLDYGRIRHEDREPLRTLLVQNYVTGCTCLLNRSLLAAALPIPAAATMHDWWLALVAAACGRLGFVPTATLDYRQHPRNQIGAKSYWQSVNPLCRLLRGQGSDALRQLGRLQAQAAALQERLAEHPSAALAGDAARVLVGEVVALLATAGWGRVRGLVRLGVRRQDWLRNHLFQLRLLTLPAVACATG